MLLMSVPFIEENDQTRARQEHLEALRRLVGNVYPNKFERSQIAEAGREDTITAIVEKFRAFEPQAPHGERPPAEAIELANQQLNKVTVRLAGRIASPPRVMGKAAFVHLSDGVTRLQIYVKRADVKGICNDAGGAEVDGWELFNLLDHGDFIGVEGYLFITKTGELSVHVQKLQFLAKALLPLPNKMHGIHDPEIRQRQRYADLIAGSLKLEHEQEELTPREVFERRSGVVREMRRILDDHGYIEVETPMLTPLATGAAAKPFKTHHNALDIDLYARIAPELYLKRLLVGGFEKVYELNRNFRNEGISSRHNPEFTMLEFYWAYADVNEMMDFCEQMLCATVFKVLGHTHVRFGELDIDFSQPFERLTMRESVARFVGEERITDENLLELFEAHVEQNLIQPTLITDFPKAISPLSKASPGNPSIAERFELFIAGMECANGFSELNDPAEQYQRFQDQMTQRDRGDEEAMVMDEDYIRALSYGMPPAAGIGIGIDRFVMLVTNRQSIRDVILFPHMRPERLHQFSWLKWMYEELASLPNWFELTEMQQAGLLVERFRMWASRPDSPAHQRRLFGDSEDEMLSTAQRALRVFRES
ncbi:MAG TPA: lysine--tRNA ligase [Blastocatellia bacterium]|nr:lysine--tRNA ligase [Blastocatellia bacterium]HAF21354.1 lysine--tRNA ligase [Blastocatellia bacterium]